MLTGRPATAEQSHLWLAVQREPESGRFNVPIDLLINGPLDADALHGALADLLARHPQLRSAFRADDGELRQYFPDAVTVALREEHRPGPYRPEPALAWAAEAGARPFDLTEAPLLRADLLRADDAALLVLTAHHLVTDGWSCGVLAEDFVRFYQARTGGAGAVSPMPEPTVPAASEADARYWQQLLDDECGPLAPIPDLVRTGDGPGPAAHRTWTLDASGRAGLAGLAERGQVSAAVAALGVWTLLLHAWSGEPDGVLGMPFAGRLDPATHAEIGLFTRVLPVRSRFEAQRPFRAVLTDLSGQVLDSLFASEVDTEALRAAVGAPELRTVFAYQGRGQRHWTVGGTELRIVEHELESAKYDLALAVAEGSDETVLRLDYDAAVYTAASIGELGDQLCALLGAAAADPDRSCLDLLTVLAERRPHEHQHGAELSDADASVLVPHRVLEHAARRPGAIAVQHGATSLSYGDLVARAGALAHWLTGQAVRPGDIVALLLPAGVDTVVAMLACSLAGAAYLPLDPAYPDAQLELVVADAAPVLLLADPAQRDRCHGLPTTVYDLSDVLAAAAGLPAHPPQVPIDGATTLNVLYTSGSTGRPKGVVLPHAGVARLVGRPEFLPLGADDVLSHLSPLNFDGATYEIWGALAHGARLVVLDKELVLDPRALRTALREHGVTTLLVTTPLLNRIIEDAPDLLQSLRRVYFGGELISVPHIRRALRWCGPGTLLHSYGPTENSFTSTWHPIAAVAEGARSVPIGRPVPGTSAYVVFEGTLRPTPPGVPGELVLGGTGVADGYLGDPARSAEKFVADPFDPRPDARLYRTGDRVRWDATGELEFIGRTDNQVKIRSQRIELGEVEAALLAHDAVESAFVTCRVGPRGDKEIVGYAVLTDPDELAGLRQHLRARLPGFAVPRHLVPIERLPLKPNGKIDRARLPAPSDGPAPAPAPARTGRRLTGGVTAPVRAAWAEVLGTDGFRDDDNFFDVGGHSLLVVQLAAALHRHTAARPTIADLFRATTVTAQTRLLIGDAPATTAAAVAVTDPGDDIAVVGMACRFAGTPDLDAFWRNLVAGRDCLPNAADPVAHEYADGRRRVARWGMLADGLGFDAGLFGFDPEQAATMDPQHGILYECLWGAVENAALRMADIHQRTSLYAGRATGPGPRALPDRDESTRADEVVGSDATFMPSRFSYWFDLFGESLLLDTACSTSLVAVHLACESLRRGASDYALAGGVSVSHPADGSYTYVPGHLYARDGFCRPFDQLASGTVGADGAGAVLLRRLGDAIRDGDPIHAVIRGSAVNNDGRAKVGYTAPGVDGQARVIRQALTSAGLSGADIDYVEGHGTGTRLGDTIEVAALTEALGADGPPVAVGSAKASIGHTNTAAGVAGLIKTVLAVREGFLPATPHVSEPIDELRRHGDRFTVLPTGRDWPRHDRPRTAGVSSFGVGGTNAHVIVQQFVPAGETA
ncbi:thiotemplate mechanism natural product synthetase [Actinoplanes sp. SE50]|uniref:non-ribosomal peptide synthetase n=1 Tax=unclassified Actinoplanes TaxID=2626549 RepID=UPI00023EC871|nr:MULTISPECIES: non-ribosomal peptide synthetase [unclassified Actinoplanes]AEV87079.1 thiotemplate mechanism natural product synthetase [Actinoplanes sp. SE50/110]ATO85477.1 thiotemplate mechanism natural product synthetase [Actinoplanes sp. SE50]SLM02889.1 thiotemplate mechanism natural product synthetase [Actinoplanes sp. SE50/110]